MNRTKRVAMRFLAIEAKNALNGLTRKKAADLVNRAIKAARIEGMHRDEFWSPVQRIWRELQKADIPYAITSSQYVHESGVPVRKEWAFETDFMNDKGKPTTVYGRVVAAGAGPVSDPLEVYDVTAYAS